MTEPVPCTNCKGEGRYFAFRIDDRRYPKTCGRCKGSGIEPSRLGTDTETMTTDPQSAIDGTERLLECMPAGPTKLMLRTVLDLAKSALATNVKNKEENNE
jgi:hypothetical protein